MTDIYKLEDGTSSVDLSPIQGLNVVENRIREHTQNKQGQGGDYEWGNAEKYQIPLVNLTQEKADQLLTWWEDMEVLTFTPDQASSGETIQMIIDGVERPLNQWHHKFKSKYAGNLVLHEVSSQSFSSSYISLSQSKSCSSFQESTSIGFVASKSCSEFIIGVSASNISGREDVPVPSCSTFRSCSTFSASDLFVSCSDLSQSFSDGYYTRSSCATTSSVTTASSCDDVSSCSDSLSGSLSAGVIFVTAGSQSCSLNPSAESGSESEAGQSCSNSAGGIS